MTSERTSAGVGCRGMGNAMWRARFAALGVAATFGWVDNASAQSSVTMYGVIEDAVEWVSNVGGHSVTELNAGAMQPERFGFLGTEDLGGGNRAIFKLESGFNLNNGAFAPSGTGFTRQAFVGLGNPTLGTVTLGYQYDFMYSLNYSPVLYLSSLLGGLGGSPGTSFLDNNLPGVTYDNSIKWENHFGPFSTGAMYGFGAQKPGTSSFMYSLHVSYTSKILDAGASYVDDKTGQPVNIAPPNSPAYDSKIFGIGAKLKLDPLVLTTVFTDARSQITYDRNDILDTGVIYYISPALFVGAEFGVAWAQNALKQAGGAKQATLGVDYSLSKRTDVYLLGVLIHATGFAKASLGLPGGVTAPSTSPSQSALRIGIRHVF
jgi:general bacterial porin, GBP family